MRRTLSLVLIAVLAGAACSAELTTVAATPSDDELRANCDWPEDLMKQAKLHYIALEGLRGQMNVEHTEDHSPAQRCSTISRSRLRSASSYRMVLWVVQKCQETCSGSAEVAPWSHSHASRS